MASSFFKFAEDDETPGVIDATGDYSVTPKTFVVEPPPGFALMGSRLIITVEDTAPMDSGFYGNNITLTNGISIWRERNGVLQVQWTDPNFPVTRNADWASYCHDVTLHSFGIGNSILTARWTATRVGPPIPFRSWLDERMVIYLNDDFTGLNGHKFQFQGQLVTRQEVDGPTLTF